MTLVRGHNRYIFDNFTDNISNYHQIFCFICTAEVFAIRSDLHTIIENILRLLVQDKGVFYDNFGLISFFYFSFNAIALRTAKTLWSFGRSKCKRVKIICSDPSLALSQKDDSNWGGGGGGG